MSDIEKYSDATFESIKHTNADGQEYWLARELQAVLEYTQWRRFSEVIERAKRILQEQRIFRRRPFCQCRQNGCNRQRRRAKG